MTCPPEFSDIDALVYAGVPLGTAFCGGLVGALSALVRWLWSQRR